MSKNKIFSLKRINEYSGTGEPPYQRVGFHEGFVCFCRTSPPFTHICKPLDRKETTLFVSVTVSE